VDSETGNPLRVPKEIVALFEFLPDEKASPHLSKI